MSEEQTQDTMHETIDLEIDRDKVARYLYRCYIVIILLFGLALCCVGPIAAAIYALAIGPRLSRKQAEALSFRLEGTTLRIDQGVYFLKRTAIPLDRVTDIAIHQGPLMRWCDIWRLDVQTAGTGQQIAEGHLYGLRDTEGVRDKLLQVRDRAVQARNS